MRHQVRLLWHLQIDRLGLSGVCAGSVRLMVGITASDILGGARRGVCQRKSSGSRTPTTPSISGYTTCVMVSTGINWYSVKSDWILDWAHNQLKTDTRGYTLDTCNPTDRTDTGNDRNRNL